MTDEERIHELPPSAKLVLKVLEYHGSMTQKGIVEESRLSQRTVRDALDRLESAGIVDEDIYIPDARQSLYRVTIESAEAEAAVAPSD